MDKHKQIDWNKVSDTLLALPEEEYRIAVEVRDFIKLDEDRYIRRGFDTDSVIARIHNLTEQRLRRKYTHETGYYDAKYNSYKETYEFSEGFVGEDA